MASNAEVAYNYFVQAGYSPAEAAGIVGNLMQESGVNPESVQAGGPGRGIAQWSAGGRWNPALMTGNSAADLQNQLGFIVSELHGPEQAANTALLQATTPEQAALVFSEDYERPGTPNNAAREANAASVYASAQSGNWAANPTGSAGQTVSAQLTAASSKPLFNRSMLTRIGIGVFSAVVALIALNALTRKSSNRPVTVTVPGQGPSAPPRGARTAARSTVPAGGRSGRHGGHQPPNRGGLTRAAADVGGAAETAGEAAAA